MSSQASDREKRRRAFRAGLRAEKLAAWFLRFKCYHIVAERLKTPVGEIDLIVRRGRTLAFVEVKERADAIQALEAITPLQRRRICRAASWFISRHPELDTYNMRFDAFVLARGGWPNHIMNAWTMD